MYMDMDNSGDLAARKRLAIPAYLRPDVEVVVGFNVLVVLVLLLLPSGAASRIVQVLCVVGPLGALFGIALRGQRWPIRREDRFALLLALGGAALIGGQL